ncbi:fungal fucose-specific lectin [Diplodia corticola]|uniref:Fungal fucose-specific lectin n=1 Tax=Diplodia corticola TaxID=236234 RepID=A0A1J9QP79_9PEZI|nr:fungal fucose-specific lectin [Diplodia corticola]OJD30257.1 fungal fucose-specific lectin [Diplodia corticola]
MHSPPGTPPPHGTLEVDVTAQRDNERQAQLQHSSSNLLSEVWVAASDKDANAPQLVMDGSLPIPKVADESAPQVIDTDTLPEAIIIEDQRRPPPRRICGLKKRTRWILVAVSVAAIVAIAVGAGVGASRSNSNSGDDSADGDMSLLSTSNLAAANFTTDGVDFHCVYYQLESKQIYLSVWNSSSDVWAAYPVVLDRSDVLKNTPIAVDIQRKSDNVHRHHVFYYGADKTIRGKAADTPYAASWDDNNGFDAEKYSGDVSSLTSYSKECETCYAAISIVYYDGSLQWTSPKADDSGQTAWTQTTLPSGLPKPADGTRLALKPLYNGTTGNGKFIAMFMTTNAKKLAKLLYNGPQDRWEGETLDVSLSANSAIAAFTAGTFVNGSDSKSNYTMQVFNTHPGEASGGVTLSSYSSSSSTWNSSLLESGFEKVLNSSGIAASQAGQVYGTVLSDGGRPQLIEWVWDMGNGTYTLTGAVNTTVAE